jgi:hypothetical protein
MKTTICRLMAIHILGLSIEDQCGNTSYAEISISVPAVPVNVDLGPDLVVTCLDESLLMPSVSGGVGSYSYQWIYQDLQIGNESSQSFQTASNSNVTVIVKMNAVIAIQISSE